MVVVSLRYPATKKPHIKNLKSLKIIGPYCNVVNNHSLYLLFGDFKTYLLPL